MKKGKIFKVSDSSKGEEKERQFLFIPASPDEANSEPVCKTQCPYGIDRCSKMPDTHVFKIIVLIFRKKEITMRIISQ